MLISRVGKVCIFFLPRYVYVGEGMNNAYGEWESKVFMQYVNSLTMLSKKKIKKALENAWLIILY